MVKSKGSGNTVHFTSHFQRLLSVAIKLTPKKRSCRVEWGGAHAWETDSIADLISLTEGASVEAVKRLFYFVDSKGILASNRGDTLAKHKLPWTRSDIPTEDVAKLTTFEAVVKYVKPTVLIGLGAQGGVFSKEILEYVSSYCERPIIFPLSNPSSKAEVLPANAYKWTKGKAIVASGSPFPPTIVDGQTLCPSQGNNLYIFPGVGLGCSLAQCPYIPQHVMVAAASRLSSLVSEEDLAAGKLYPEIDQVRAVSLEVAVACIETLQEMGLAKANLPDNKPDLKKIVKNAMWQPEYMPEQFYLQHDLQKNYV